MIKNNNFPLLIITLCVLVSLIGYIGYRIYRYYNPNLRDYFPKIDFTPYILQLTGSDSSLEDGVFNFSWDWYIPSSGVDLTQDVDGNFVKYANFRKETLSDKKSTGMKNLRIGNSQAHQVKTSGYGRILTFQKWKIFADFKKIEDLESKIKSILDENIPVLIVSGAGIGKSTLINSLARNYADQLDKQRILQSETRIPIIVPMKEWRVQSGFNKDTMFQIIRSVFRRKYQVKFDEDDFEYLHNKGKFIYLFDGIDEIARSSTSGVLKLYIDAIVDLVKSPKSPAIISMRPEAFHTMEELHRSIPLLTDHEEIDPPGDYCFYPLGVLPFDEDQLMRYLRARDMDNQANLLKSVFRDNNIIYRPLILSIILELEINPNTFENNEISIRDIYKKLIAHVIDRDRNQNKIPIINRNTVDKVTTTIRENIFADLSIKTTSKSSYELRLSFPEMILKKVVKNYFTSIRNDELNDLLQYLRQNTILAHDKNIEYFSFRHKSFAEYHYALNVKEGERKKLVNLDHSSLRAVIQFIDPDLIHSFIEGDDDVITDLIIRDYLIYRSTLNDSELQSLTKMKKMKLHVLPITELPDWMAELKNLEVLSLSDTSITELPDWITSWHNSGDLYYNDIFLQKVFKK